MLVYNESGRTLEEVACGISLAYFLDKLKLHDFLSLLGSSGEDGGWRVKGKGHPYGEQLIFLVLYPTYTYNPFIYTYAYTPS